MSAKAKMIKIINISSDKQRCIDNIGNTYTINDIDTINRNYKNKISNIDISVTVAHKRDGNAYIKYKKNCKENIFSDPKYHSLPNKSIIGNSIRKKTYNLAVIVEDASSSNKIIEQIINKFAEDNSINIRLDMYSAKGNSYLTYYLARRGIKYKYVLAIYDSATDDKIVQSIEDAMFYLNSDNKTEFVRFSPKCSEECILSFKRLKTDIIGTSNEDLKLLNNIDNYMSTGAKYIFYNKTHGYFIKNIKINWGYRSKYTKKNVNNIEQYLSDRVANITNLNPYDFNKNAGICWLNDCRSSKAKCKWEEVYGSRNPNNASDKCNKTLLNDSKIRHIIDESLFGGIYDSLYSLFSISKKGNLNSKVAKQIIRRF